LPEIFLLISTVGEERIPYAEGFKKSKAVITNDEIVELAQKVKDASPL
jgi:hypothetical protein